MARNGYRKLINEWHSHNSVTLFLSSSNYDDRVYTDQQILSHGTLGRNSLNFPWSKCFNVSSISVQTAFRLLLLSWLWVVMLLCVFYITIDYVVLVYIVKFFSSFMTFSSLFHSVFVHHLCCSFGQNDFFLYTEQHKGIGVSLLVSLQTRVSHKLSSRLKLFLFCWAKIWLSSKRKHSSDVIDWGGEPEDHTIGWKYYVQRLHKSEIRWRPSDRTKVTDPQSRLS